LSKSRLRADLTPLRTSRDFRRLYASRTVIALGTQATEVALLVQAKQLTGSTVAVGLIGAVELLPLVVFGLYGGLLADRFDRRRLILACEVALGCCAALLMLNALARHPAVWPLYAVTALMMAAAALQRPSLDASIPRVVPRDQLTAAAALLSMSQNVCFLAGTTLGGLLAAGPGAQYVYGLDLVCYVVSFCFLWLVRRLPAPEAGDEPVTGLRSILAGFAYARGRRDLLGSYLADLAAMTLAYPAGLFPFVAAYLHAPWAVGLMFAAPSVGALGVTVVSGWMGRVRRHGLAIAISAAVWGLLVTGFGLAPDLAVALGCLVLSGAADMVSGIFRTTLWNQTIPDQIRGRMAGLELLSYGVGPSAGQIRGGAVASVTSVRFSLVTGGLSCAGAVGLVCLALPAFTRYRAEVTATAAGPAGTQEG
jgi:MFS family permease